MTRQLVKPRMLPATVRKMLAAQCDGEWDRVTVDDDGSFTVHNNPAQAKRFVQLEGGSSNGRTPGFSPANVGSSPAPPARKQAPVAKKAQPAPSKSKRKHIPTPKPPPDPELVALASLVGTQAPRPKPGVRVVKADSVRVHDDDTLWSDSTGTPDWAALDVATTATKLQAICQAGLPENLKFSVKPDVLAMYGMDFDLMEDSIRHPERVEIRPESLHQDKGYPILSFHRGDITTILGMRIPSAPAVIAAYASSRLMPDERRTKQSSGGGGGARKTTGLPSTVKASIKALRTLGAELLDDRQTAERSTEVKFHGQDVGRIALGTVPKEQVRSDYQRTLRKINAIREREAAHA